LCTQHGFFPALPRVAQSRTWWVQSSLISLDLVRKVKTGILDLLFPPRCVGCGQIGSYLCAKCQAEFELLEPPLCLHCGCSNANGGLCPRCQRAPLQIDGVRSVAYFDGVLRQAIHRLKYGNLQAVAIPLGRFMAEYWKAHHIPAEVIVPVPLHISRLRERGYNQATLLARELGKSIGLPVSENSLVRVRATRPQVGLNAQERKENVRHAFRCTNAELRHKQVLLVDDVYTTGATLEACSVTLHQIGVRSVWALTLARAR